MNNQYNVNVFYTDEELQNALQQDTTLLNGNVHIFSNDASAISELSSRPNVEIHGATGMFDKIKSFFSSDSPTDTIQQFAVTPDEQTKYTQIIENGGTVVFTSKMNTLHETPPIASPEQHVAGDVGVMEPDMADTPLFMDPPTNRQSYPTTPGDVDDVEANPLLQTDRMETSETYLSQDGPETDTVKRSFNTLPPEADMTTDTQSPYGQREGYNDSTNEWQEPSSFTSPPREHYDYERVDPAKATDAVQSEPAYGLHEEPANDNFNEPTRSLHDDVPIAPTDLNPNYLSEKRALEPSYELDRDEPRDLLGNGLNNVRRPGGMPEAPPKTVTPPSYDLDEYEPKDLLGNPIRNKEDISKDAQMRQAQMDEEARLAQKAEQDEASRLLREQEIGKAHENRRHDLP